MKKLLCLLAAASLCLAAGSCSLRQAASSEAGGGPSSGGPASSAAAESTVQPDADDPGYGPDGLGASYYNDYLGMTLEMDGSGGYALSGGGEDVKGKVTYDAAGGTIEFSGGGGESAVVDGDGDITFSDRTGYFIRDYYGAGNAGGEAAGSASAEPGYLSSGAARDAESEDNGDGTVRYRDYARQVAFTCPTEMSVLPDALTDAVTVSDGGGGFAVGRNVTDLYAAWTGTDDAFGEMYAKEYVFADFAALYGQADGYTGLKILHENVEGRIVSAEVCIKSGETETYAKEIMYTSTYGDGTVNYIFKSFFAPSGDTERFNALANGVIDMGATRRN